MRTEFYGLQTVPERGVVRSREPFKFWWAPTISLERLIASGAVNLGGRLVWQTDDRHRSPVYHADRRHLCTTRWAWDTALALRGSVSGSEDLRYIFRLIFVLMAWFDLDPLVVRSHAVCWHCVLCGCIFAVVLHTSSCIHDLFWLSI